MTFLHESLESLPQLRQVATSLGRVYEVKTGQDVGAVFPSITRILGSKPKPGLDAWRQRVGVKEAARITARAGIRGSSVHKLAECYLGNLELPEYTPNIAELWNPLRDWFSENITKVRAQECDVYSNRLKVAGRMDLLAEYQGALAVIDIKTSTKPKIEAFLADYWKQTTFYGCALYEMLGLKVKHLILPIVNPETGLQVFMAEPIKHFADLKYAIDEFYASYAVGA